VLNSRASAMSSFQNRVRNKSAVAGSIWGLFWDDVNFEGATAPSVLDGVTHMVTLDGKTNVDASSGDQFVVCLFSNLRLSLWFVQPDNLRFCFFSHSNHSARYSQSSGK
jgi:hypothetical protein